MKTRIVSITAVLCCSLLLPACDNQVFFTGETNSPATSAEDIQQVTAAGADKPASNPQQTQFNIGNKSYLFDVSDHSVDELEALLQRADEISQLEPDSYDQLEIVMILHGPDIEWFTERNYTENRQLVDLAARLDSFEIIDMKVCETTMKNRGVKREEVPAFIESVPYSPAEMERLLQEGYINL